MWHVWGNIQRLSNTKRGIFGTIQAKAGSGAGGAGGTRISIPNGGILSTDPTLVTTMSPASTKLPRKMGQKSGSGPPLFTASSFESSFEAWFDDRQNRFKLWPGGLCICVEW